MKLNRDLVYWWHFITVLLFGGLVLGYPSLKIVLLNEVPQIMPSITDPKSREVMFANINAFGSTGMAFRVFFAYFIDVIGARWSLTMMMGAEVLAQIALGLSDNIMIINAAYFVIGAAGGAVLIASQYTANLQENYKFMTANFNVAFAMSGIVFYLMLAGTWAGVSRQTFCLVFAGVILVMTQLAHFFYFENIQVSTAEVDEEGLVDPMREKAISAKDFVFEEVWEVLRSSELLLLALFYSLNSVCVVYVISTLNKQLDIVGSGAATNFSVVYSISSLNVFIFAWVLQKQGFTVGYVWIIISQVLGILSMHQSNEQVHQLGFILQNMGRNPTQAFTFTQCNTFFPRKQQATLSGCIIFFSSFLNFLIPLLVRWCEDRGEYRTANWAWIITLVLSLGYCIKIQQVEAKEAKMHAEITEVKHVV